MADSTGLFKYRAIDKQKGRWNRPYLASVQQPITESVPQMARFIRLLRPKEGMELLVNVDCITKVEVRYGVRSADPNDTLLHEVSLRQGLTSPDAIRAYTIFIGSDSYLLIGDGNDPVGRVIQEIYENAIRAPEPHELPGHEAD